MEARFPNPAAKSAERRLAKTAGGWGNEAFLWVSRLPLSLCKGPLCPRGCSAPLVSSRHRWYAICHSVPAQPPHLALGGIFEVPCQAEELQELHGVPSHVNLPPLQPMPARVLEGVVIVVPALAEGQDTDEPVVHGDVTRVPVLKAPDMAHRIHSPSDVPHPDDSEEEPPQEAWEATKSVETDHGQDDGMERVGFLEKPVKPLR
mmetsp:Transcript_73995/g.163566  ORF Transcript_73995/g.163566 Transcript_73995/m.163566 type:complete len:204 (+) Transcript_73995:202-813(+)